MKTKHHLSIAVAATLALLASTNVTAADACSAYKWDVTTEVQLYKTAPNPVNVASDRMAAPFIEAGKLYALTLQPQEKVQYLLPPSKKMLADGAFGGLLKLRVTHAGAYRLAIDSGYWLDVVHDGKQLPTLDFNGSAACDGPHKILVFELPAGVELTLQVSAASASQARLTVTPVAMPKP